MAGDNNLEESAIIDLNEMEQVGSTSDINIVVELDSSAMVSILVTTTGSEQNDFMYSKTGLPQTKLILTIVLSYLLNWDSWEM